MGPSQESSGNVDFVDSVSIVTFDVRTECFQATYDSDRDLPSLAVVALVATALRKDPRALAPLQFSIETAALDKLATESARDRAGWNRVTFRYEGLDVTVSNEGIIEAVPPENT
jgi:hypothetical protein